MKAPEARICSGVARTRRLSEEGIPTPLHVLTLTPFYPSAGDEVRGCFVAETLRSLAAQDVGSSVIAVDSIYHARRNSSREFPAEQVRCFSLPGTFGLSTAGKFLGAFLLERVRRIHRISPIHVIHAHSALPCGHAAALISRRLGIPFVVTVHGLDVFNRCFENGLAAEWRRNVSRKVYQNASKVICISDKVRRLLGEGIKAPVAAEVIYNGTDAGLFVPTSTREQTLTILVVGNLLAGKGHELVLRALARLRYSYPELQCDMIGEGADRERFAQLAEALGIGGNVRFLGRRSRSQVAEAMRTCTVFAMPSRYEGLGCVYLEAMASGVPAIACHGQGIDEIIRHGENGWLIPVDGLEELVQAFNILLGNSDLRSQMGKCARQTILDNLTLSHQAQKLRMIYEAATR